MNLVFKKGRMEDLNEIEQVYERINDFLESNINYPGWIKGVYPTRENARDAILNRNLHVARYQQTIVGTVILNHQPECGYDLAEWNYESVDYSDVFVIHTLVVHPDYLKCGIGLDLMNYIEDYSRTVGMKALRLDVYESNLPAIRLYEKCGYQYVATVDLGLSQYGLDQFKLYERVL